MAHYRTGFQVLGVLAVHEQFIETQLFLRRAALNPRRRTLALAELARVEKAHLQLGRELEGLAQRSAADAETEIRRQLQKTRKRPDTGLRPHLRDAIVARPEGPGGFRVPTGEVGIADVDELDKVVNPLTPDAGPYWRTQELGSTAHLDRQIHGLFFGPGATGGGEEPDPGQFRVHPVFIAGAGGLGTIQRPIVARHFIAKGARIAGRRWLAQLKVIQARALSNLAGP